MGSIYLVRHGQASFGSANYDVLSELGWRQAQRLGTYWRQGEDRPRAGFRPHFEAVYTGTLTRQVQTWQGIAQGAGVSTEQAVQRRALNEYSVAALIEAAHPEPLEKSREPAAYARRLHALRMGLTGWIQGNLEPQGLPSYAQFRQDVMAVLEEARTRHRGDVLVVTSAGPIAAVLAHLLQTPAAATAELNIAYRNAALTELAFDRRGYRLMGVNALPHLQSQAHRRWITWI